MTDIAISHDYLNQQGGAERVVLTLGQLWPQAPIYTSLYRPESTFPEFAQHDVRTSWLNALPVDKRFRSLLPLYPHAMGTLGPVDADVMIASSSGWAHGIPTTERTKSLIYCHTPARWLHTDSYLGASSRAKLASRPLNPWLRRWDLRAARRATGYVANSRFIRDRILRTYGIGADVIYPPVDVQRFTPSPRGERLLVVSRLLPYKRIDLVVEAATRLGLPLDVVGCGPALGQLRALAGPSVTFHGRLEDAAVTELFQQCSAFCLPGIEDFGITPVEANAAGKPVVAFGAGGALESIIDGVTGVHFTEPTVEALTAALHRVDGLSTDPVAIAAAAARFSPQVFEQAMLTAVASLTAEPVAPRVAAVSAA